METLQSPRRPFEWRCRNRLLALGERTLVMGVVNVTPDSFSDGGAFLSPERAVEHARSMIATGADLIDIGGVSTRPGAAAVSVDEELRRVLPVVEALADGDRVPISVDTTSFEVARQALASGAEILNDVSGLRAEPSFADLAADYGAGLILMHSRGTPETMQSLADYKNLVDEVRNELQAGIDIALQRGVGRPQILLDPGIGFAKTPQQNVTLLQALPQLLALGQPLLVGTSRKSFLGHLTGRDVGERMAATVASVTAAIFGGASVIRVHDAAAMRDAALVADALCMGRSV